MYVPTTEVMLRNSMLMLMLYSNRGVEIVKRFVASSQRGVQNLFNYITYRIVIR